MSNQDHICIAITKSVMGGAQKYVLMYAQQLVDEGKKVTVLAGGDGLLFQELEKRNISYIKLSQSQRDISLIKEFKLAHELYKILIEIKPTTLHLNSSKLGGVGAFVGRIAQIKEIVFVAHGWAFNEARPWWQKKLFYILYWITLFLSTKTICVSKQTCTQISFLPFIKNKLKVEYTNIETPDFYSKEDAKKQLCEQFFFLDIHKKWLVVLAELHYTKGHDVLFEALVPLIPTLEDWHIVCIGSGERESELRAMVHHKNLEKYVFFTGFVADAARYLKAFEVLCLPSRTEALPLVLLEAKLGYIPIIASNVGGIPEIVTNDSIGVLFEKENVEELRKLLHTKLTANS
jgi:glycosyltransferase involved in cell wall biosynthesis